MSQDKLKTKILLIDDDITTLMLLHASIVQWGYSVVEANNSDEGLVILAEPDPPSIIIVDWMMPKVSGLVFCEKVHATYNPRPYLILLTHNKGTINLVKAIEAGADEFIEKPVNLEELRCRLLVGVRAISRQYIMLDNELNKGG